MTSNLRTHSKIRTPDSNPQGNLTDMSDITQSPVPFIHYHRDVKQSTYIQCTAPHNKTKEYNYLLCITNCHDGRDGENRNKEFLNSNSKTRQVTSHVYTCIRHVGYIFLVWECNLFGDLYLSLQLYRGPAIKKCQSKEMHPRISQSTTRRPWSPMAARSHQSYQTCQRHSWMGASMLELEEPGHAWIWQKE
jgi:hypothetical protein